MLVYGFVRICTEIQYKVRYMDEWLIPAPKIRKFDTSIKHVSKVVEQTITKKVV